MNNNGDNLVYLGLDTLETLLNKNNKNYPPYNVIQVNEFEHRIDVAVAGFQSNDLRLKLSGVYLSISAVKVNNNDETRFLYKGIATRSFEKQFVITNNGAITNAVLNNGILSVTIKYPLSVKETNIPIQSGGSSQNLLTD